MNAVIDTPKGIDITTLTAHEVVMLAASSFSGEFSEWDLSVACWRIQPARFGMRGYESLYPDHKRVTTEIAGQQPRNPMVRGEMERTRPNYYRLTALGRSHAARIRDPHEAERIYNGVGAFIKSNAFRRWRDNPAEPQSAGDVDLSAFIAIGSIADARAAAQAAFAWLGLKNVSHLTRYHPPRTQHRPATIHFNDVAALDDFLTAIEQRFPHLTKPAPKARRR